MNFKFLRFFNKSGTYSNFEWNEDKQIWEGNLEFDKVSVDLIEDSQIYIMEEVWDSSSNMIRYAYPHDNLFSSMEVIKESGDEEFFLYQFDYLEDDIELVKSQSINYEIDYVPADTISPTGSTTAPEGITITTEINSKALQVNVGFCPSSENEFNDVLIFKDYQGTVFARINIFGEGEEEDKRLSINLQNLGYDINSIDEKIFDTSDINEDNPDWKLLNRKRKELLIEFYNIFPYTGSYKAIINILKYFGYQNVKLKEYWLNVDSSSVNFGKFKHTNIVDIFSEGAGQDIRYIPSKVYKKTSKFGLFYDITIESGEFDDDGIPIVEEVFEFTPEEVLIKIYALKQKLKNYFLPLNARIVDIVGEAVFFTKYDINAWNDQTKIDFVDLNIKPCYKIIPDQSKLTNITYNDTLKSFENRKRIHYGCIQDLRPLEHLGCPIGSDLTIGGDSSLLIWRIGVGLPGSSVTSDTFKLTVDVPAGQINPPEVEIVIEQDYKSGKEEYSNYEVVDMIIKKWKSLNDPILDNFYIYQEGGTSGIMRIVQKNPVGAGTIYLDWSDSLGSVTPVGLWNINEQNINISPGGSFGASGPSVSYFYDCFLGYFDDYNISVENLPDQEGVPVGYPIVLKNCSFKVNWEDMNVTYDQLDQLDFDILGSNEGNLLYSNFDNSFEIIGVTSIDVTPPSPINSYLGDMQYIVAGTTGFPSNFPNEFFYSWENLGTGNFYEMEWKVYKKEDDNPAWEYSSGRQNIWELEEHPLILPYSGNYTVELHLWDHYNGHSKIVDENIINVCQAEVDFIGWYQSRELDYTWDTKRYDKQSNYSDNDLNDYLTWDEYASSWELPVHPNEELDLGEMSFHSLDGIEFYQSITNPITNPLVSRDPYHWNYLGDNATWDDSYHLWWDMCGTRLTMWEIDDILGSTSTIFMIHQNTPLDLSKTFTVVANEAGLASIVGSMDGDVGIVDDTGIAYVYDGSWNKTKHYVDYLELSLNGTLKERFIDLTNQLNNLNQEDHPLLTNFIFYYNERYDISYALEPYIRAVSIDFDKPKRHQIKYDGLVGDIESYETVNFGYLGDIPAGFEIYFIDGSIGSTATITINEVEYIVGATNLADLADELNGVINSPISDYEYNLVIGASGWTGGTGPGATSSVKVIAIKKDFVTDQPIRIQYENIVGTTRGRSLIKNPSWNNLRIHKFAQEYPLLTLMNWTYDNSLIKGKTNPKWELIKENDIDWVNIYYDNPYFSYCFTEKGSYSLRLTLSDTNGNTKNVLKQEHIKIV